MLFSSLLKMSLCKRNLRSMMKDLIDDVCSPWIIFASVLTRALCKRHLGSVMTWAWMLLSLVLTRVVCKRYLGSMVNELMDTYCIGSNKGAFQKTPWKYDGMDWVKLASALTR